MKQPYREDIDWLRAIAVLSVVGFHWHVALFHGGYVGVDIFFVISGFLITRIIQAEIGAGEFSFASFYERRIRRLLPALYLVVAATALPSFYFLLQSERHEFFKSVIAVATFSSNILFWRQTGYFGQAADEKLLLHTWSLSVEEQFYLVLPVLIWALFAWQRRAKRQAPGRDGLLCFGLGILALASFAFSQWLVTNSDTTSAFFLSPPRAWEFLVGSLIAAGKPGALHNVHLRRTVFSLGFALIAISVFTYRSSTVFPGLSALLPCMGAALFIWAGTGTQAPVRPFWSPLNITGFFGKISYSLYLWHLPVFIYARFSQTNLAISGYKKFLLFVFTVILSYASYRYVEQPFRRRRLFAKRSTLFAIAGCSTAAVILAGVAGVIEASRPDAGNPLSAYTNYNYPAVYRVGECFTLDWSTFKEKACLAEEPGKTNVLVWGDSLAAHYVYGLRMSLDAGRINLLQASGVGCLPTLDADFDIMQACRGMPAQIKKFIYENKPDVVVMSGDWPGHTKSMGFAGMIAELRRTIAALKSLGIGIVVVGPPVQFRGALPSMLLRAQARGVSPSVDELLEPGNFDLDKQMKDEFQNESGLTYVSVLDAVCPQRQCPVLLAGGVPLTWDSKHLTPEGSILIGQHIAKAVTQTLAQTGR